jgi:hypothetical protein
MELDLGAGRVTLCMLDLEERFSTVNAPAMEPAAQLLAGQIVRYAQSAPLSPRVAQVALLGTAPRGSRCSVFDTKKLLRCRPMPLWF